jgi:hypothetical protein
VYLLGCCGVGLFFLIRSHWVVWRQPVLWAFAICLLVGADLFNSWPRLWMSYDTALPAGGFAIQQIALTLAVFAGMAALLGVSFIAAESLSRRAFPHHMQLWKLWSAPAAASKPVLGQLTAGYLMVGLFFAYEVLLYGFAQDRLGWWTPSDTLINPDLFGAYFPFLPAVANSLQAGFWEECLFRAVPLACAALLGEKFGGRRFWIAGAMIVQALIFGAGHAGYATQPAYARVVELIIPSLAFGALYLAFGLLPGIILHYAFDLVWFSMPIFMSSAPRARIEQVFVLVLAFLPLGIALLARARAGAWKEIPETLRNGAWKPQAAPPAAHVDESHQPSLIAPAVARLLPVAGLAGLVLWIAVSDFGAGTPKLSVSRTDAEQIARDALAERGVSMDPAWRVFSQVASQPGPAHHFVWRTAGREAYGRLVGTYLAGPHWIVRFAKFEGDVAGRAREVQVRVDDGRRAFRIQQQLAEATPGVTLTEEAAGSIAQAAALAPSQIPPESFKKISAEAQKRPSRMDWTFEFADDRNYGLTQGQARIRVVVAGDQVLDMNRYVYIPEEWARNERARRNLPDLIGTGCVVLLAGLVGAGVIGAIVRWSRRRPFSVRSFLILFAVLFILGVAGLASNWPVLRAQFQTAQPYLLQAAVVGGVNLAAAFILAISLALAGGALKGRLQTSGAAMSRGRTLLLGASLGAVITAIAAAGRAWTGPEGPEWTGFNGVAAWIPFVAGALMPLNSTLVNTVAAGTLLSQVAWFSAMWRRRAAGCALLVLLGILVTGSSGLETLSGWLASGMVFGILLAAAGFLVLRHAPTILPAAVATMIILNTLASGLAQSYPAALPAAIAGVLLVGVSQIKTS